MTTLTKTDTADSHWDTQWATLGGNSKWRKPEEDVIAWADDLSPGARILDLGAGVGRHALWLAEQGFNVTALDAAPQGLAHIRKMSGIDTVLARMDRLPFEDAVFDHVLSWNVIYHGDQVILSQTIAEITRVLRPGGSFLGTMLSKRRLPSECAAAPGREISGNTWVFDAPGTDKMHPHYFCDAGELLALFQSFEVLKLRDQQHEKPGSWHWHLEMERL